MSTLPTTYDPSLALATFVKLVRASETVVAVAHRDLPAAGLTIGQFAVLEALLHRGPLCQRDIARKVLRSGGNITTVLDNLEQRGLVRRERGAGDRRFVTVHLTDPGAALIEAVFPRVAAEIDRALQGLDRSEQQELGRLCRKLGHAAAPRKGD